MSTPILYSFRRCPYAMRARLALCQAGLTLEMREVVLKDKPQSLIDISPKATVPVLHVPDQNLILEESLDIMRYALQHNDPEGWLNTPKDDHTQLIDRCHAEFIPHLNKYKYAARFNEDIDPLYHRGHAMTFIRDLDQIIGEKGALAGPASSLCDFAIFPFIRQFSMVDQNWFKNEPLPHLHPWLQSKLNSTLFQTIMKKYPQWQKGDDPTYVW